MMREAGGERLILSLDRLEDDRARIHEELEVNLNDTHPKTIEMHGTVVRDVEGDSPRALIVLNDVTERELLEEQVNRTERLAALGELATSLAHEIKNPLTSIQGFVQLLPQRVHDEEFVKKTSEVIERESSRLNTLVENLVSFGKPQLGSRSEIQLLEILDDVEMLVKQRLENEEIKYRRDTDNELKVYGDPQKLKQVLLNLIMNALDAMSPGDTLTVSAQSTRRNFTQINVIDTGKGMNEEEIDRIYNPFYTTKEEGTGLGLAISHRIIQEHGGSIVINSEPGEGTTVKISLPPESLQDEMEKDTSTQQSLSSEWGTVEL